MKLRRVSLTSTAGFVLLGFAASLPAKAAKPSLCPEGRFQVTRGSLVGGVPEVIAITNSQLSVVDVCPAVRVRLKARKNFTSVRAKWRGCGSVLTGKVTLAAKIEAPDCNTMRGFFRAKKAKVNNHFQAQRSAPPVITGTTTTTVPTTTTTLPRVCGDRVVVPDEICDPPGQQAGCSAGEVCNTDCRSCTTCGNGTIDPGETCDASSGVASCSAAELCSVDCKACLRAICETCTPGMLKIESLQSLEFRAVPPGVRQTLAFTIQNTDTAATSQLYARFAVDSASFEVNPAELVLGPKESKPVNITFAPLRSGHQSAKLTVAASACNRPVVQLLAHGFGGSTSGTGPTLAADPLFFADFAGATFITLADGTRLPADNTLHTCQNANHTGTGDLCATNADCVTQGETCTLTSACVGGSRAAQVCNTPADCPGGFCRSSSLSSDPVDICGDGAGSFYLMTDIGTFTDPNVNASTELSTSIVHLQFDPQIGARTAADIVARTTDETTQIACDDLAPGAGGLVYVPEFFNVDFPATPCSRDQREALAAFSKSTGQAVVMLPDIAAAAGYGECDDFDQTSDLEVTRDGSAIFASLPLTGLSRIWPTPLAISPDIIDQFQVHPDGSIIYVTTTDSVSTGSLNIYKISPDQAVAGALRLAELTPCVVQVPNNCLQTNGCTSVPCPADPTDPVNRGGTLLGLSSFAIGRAAPGSSDGVLLVSFVTRGGLADLGPNLLVRGTVAVTLPAERNADACTVLGLVNLEFLDPMTF